VDDLSDTSRHRLLFEFLDVGESVAHKSCVKADCAEKAIPLTSLDCFSSNGPPLRKRLAAEQDVLRTGDISRIKGRRFQILFSRESALVRKQQLNARADETRAQVACGSFRRTATGK
jgi:hypothetical protein